MKRLLSLEFTGRAIARLFVASLTLLVPRDKDLWVFGSGWKNKFTDNAKCLFLYCNNRPEVRSVWITESNEVFSLLSSKNLPVRKRGSISALWTALRAGVYVYDVSPEDINYAASRGALLVNLWHGTPIKTIGLDSPPEISSNILQILGGSLVGNLIVRSRFFWMFRPITLRKPHLLACTSDALAPIFMSAFGVDRNAIQITGFPRNDVLFSDCIQNEEPESLFVKSIQDKGGKILFYLPTFRDSGANHLPNDNQQIRLEAILKKFNYYIVLKLHPKDTANFELRSDVNHILPLPSDLDVYTVLNSSIALITDYSSIMFDYLLLNRPMIFHCHDLDRYQAQDRKMYFNYEDITPGPKAFTFEDLERHIGDLCAGKADEYAGQRHQARERLHQYVDGNSSLRTFEAIREHQTAGERPQFE